MQEKSAMSKGFKIFVLVVVVLTAAGVIWFRRLQTETRKHSPEQTAVEQNLGIKVTYCSPAVRGRAIFGGLVPFGEVWRTGANEPTTFDTETALLIDGKTLPAGQYTLWTVPGEISWTVIWNSGHYPWGVSWGGKASRKPEKDVLTVEVPVQNSFDLQENFEISFSADPLALDLRWEYSRVRVPLAPAS